MNCSRKFQEEPEICTTLTAEGQSSLFPRPDCRNISRALNVSQLKTKYHDCPGSIENAAITNISRIIRHFNDDSAVDPQRCVFEATSFFVDLDIKAGHDQKAWPMEICYRDRVVNEKRCSVYIPGEDKTNLLAENHVVANATRYLVGMQPREQCRIVDEKTFNPLLLEYKNGCYIVYNREHCTAMNCPKKIFYDNKRITGIEYQGQPIFSYFPDSLDNPLFSVSSILEDVFKKSTRTIRNFTELKTFLKNKNNIIHGIGCLEDILPEFFSKKSLNGCGPMPFIVDGYIEEGETFFVSLRMAIEDIHSPRLIRWTRLYNAVTTYQSIHPLKSWTMNVLL